MSDSLRTNLIIKELKPEFLDAQDGTEKLIQKYYDRARLPPKDARDNAHLGNLGKLLKFVKNVRLYYDKPNL